MRLHVELVAVNRQRVVRKLQLEVSAGVALKSQVRKVLRAAAQKQLLRAQQICVRHTATNLEHCDGHIVSGRVRVVCASEQVVGAVARLHSDAGAYARFRGSRCVLTVDGLH